MSYGLEDATLKKIQLVFSKFPLIQKAILYGSRAKGNYKTGSDIDLCLVGDHLTLPLLYQVEEALDNLFSPYSFDVSIYSKLSNQDLIDHIDRVGIPIYSIKKEASSK